MKGALEKGLVRLGKEKIAAWALNTAGPSKVGSYHMLEAFAKRVGGGKKK